QARVRAQRSNPPRHHLGLHAGWPPSVQGHVRPVEALLDLAGGLAAEPLAQLNGHRLALATMADVGGHRYPDVGAPHSALPEMANAFPDHLIDGPADLLPRDLGQRRGEAPGELE